MDIDLARIDSLSQRLSAMHATEGVQALDAEDRRNITEAAEVLATIAETTRLIQQKREVLKAAVIKIICEALRGEDGCPDCGEEPEQDDSADARH